MSSTRAHLLFLDINIIIFNKFFGIFIKYINIFSLNEASFTINEQANNLLALVSKRLL